MSNKKTILIVVDWFAPGYKAGGPIQSCVNLAFALKNRYEIKVLTSDTDHGEKQPYQGIVSGYWITPLDPQIKTYYIPRARLGRKIIAKALIDSGADFVYLNHLFSPYFVIVPLWLKWTNKIKAKFVVCPRGALYESALAIKKWKKLPFLFLFKWAGIHRRVRFHATNERERAAILKFFPGSSVVIADNLPKSDQPQLSLISKTSGELKCVYISRIHPIKNLLLFLKSAEPVKAHKLSITIVGPLEDKNYWRQCEREIENMPSHISVNYRGSLPNHDLINVLHEHHLFVLPTSGENFGHAIFESFVAGRPVLISNQTPWTGLAGKHIGWDFPLSQPELFSDALQKAVYWDQGEFTEYARNSWEYARSFIHNPEIVKNYLNLFS